MKKAEIKILLVEDDSTSGKALSEIIKRAGYSCHWAKSSPEVLNLLKFQTFHFAVVDCLLPQINGVDLVKKFRELPSTPFPVVLMSGIFRDPQFANDVIQKTGALKFLQKPINSEALLSIMEDHFASEIEPQNDLSENIYAKETLSNEEVQDIFAKTNTVHGFQLPRFISLLLPSTLSGHLNIIERSGEISSISFAKGHITYVNKRNSRSFFGVLLVEKGFASEEEVNESLKMTSQKPLGERLVDRGILSPHMIDVVRAEQMKIRLSEIIQDTTYDISFLPEDVTSSDVEITIDQFPSLLKDWCWSKISFDWLKTYFRGSMEMQIQLRNANEVARAIQSLKLEEKGVFNATTLFQAGQALQEILKIHSSHEEPILRALYYLLLQKRVLLRPQTTKSVNYQEQQIRLEKLYAEIENADPFTVLGLTKEARSKEINKIYLDMAKALHPDKWGPDAPSSLRDVSQKVFSLVTKAYDLIKDDTRRKEYLKNIELGQAQDAFQAETELGRINQFLQLNKVREASEILLRLPKSKLHESEIRLYSCWIKARKVLTPEAGARLAEEIRNELGYIPPEDRHSALYFFVRGIMHRMMGNFERAQVNMQRCLYVDSHFDQARKEMTLIEQKIIEQNKFRFLDTMVGKILGSKKKVI